jgi:hypothetical protein
MRGSGTDCLRTVPLKATRATADLRAVRTSAYARYATTGYTAAAGLGTGISAVLSSSVPPARKSRPASSTRAQEARSLQQLRA